VGLVGLIDPPREGIRDVTAKCKEAGIRVLMITGDYALTACAIATQIGIFDGSSIKEFYFHFANEIFFFNLILTDLF
jgi:magnesium-transporting ATPase (P-type)